MYEKYGTKCVDYFNGMFAFVILDTKQNRLFGARDRLGKKPFYYRWNDKGFEFASQPEPIHIGNDFTINDTARKLYLHHGYISEPYPDLFILLKFSSRLGGSCDLISENVPDRDRNDVYW
jgi:asparagine synthase (glutamine-hydrolysing)